MKKLFCLVWLISLVGCADLTDDVRRSEDRLTDLEGRVTGLEGMLNNIINQAESTQTDVDNLQLQANSIQVTLTQMASNEGVVEVLDPCGDYPGHYDEVLIRTTSNRLIAYFESGGNRFLTILTPGSYQTTDAQRCSFNVSASGQVL